MIRKFLRRVLIWFIAIFSVVIIGGILFAFLGNYSDGVRAGQIIKLSKKGYFVKTYEGQLNTGGFGESSGDITSSIWNFSVYKNDKKVIEDLNRAIDKGARIKLYYDEKYVKVPFLGDTRYFVTKVEIVSEHHNE